MFPFPYIAPAFPGPPLTFKDSAISASSLTTYTFSSCDIGDPHPARLVIVAVEAGASNRTIVSATIGGVAATIACQVTDSFSRLAIIYAVVPTGTTADIVIEYSGSQSYCGIGWWIASPASTTPHDTDTNTAGSGTAVSASLNTTAGGFWIAVARAGGTGSGRTYSWNVGTERYDEAISGENDHTGADADGTSTATGVTITATASNTKSTFQIAAASWGPQ